MGCTPQIDAWKTIPFSFGVAFGVLFFQGRLAVPKGSMYLPTLHLPQKPTKCRLFFIISMDPTGLVLESYSPRKLTNRP